MTLSKPVAIGRWWFQNRSLSPLPLFLLLVILPPDFTPTPGIYALGIVGVLVAEALRLWAVGYAGSATRTRGDVVPSLVHCGPYRFVRNPLYIANILMYTSAGVIFGFIYLSIAIFIYSAIQYTFIIRFEESILEKSFGAAYTEYQQKVPRWFGLTQKIESSPHVFSLTKSLRSERSTFYSMTAMAVLFVVKQAIIGR